MSEESRQLSDIFSELDGFSRYNKIRDLYWQPPSMEPDHGGPYEWQAEFNDAGSRYMERGLMCGNRTGKSFCGAAEVAVHATGLYPPWWQGRRFTTPVSVWVGSETNEQSRDIVQKALLGGTLENLGTGFIPRDTIHPNGGKIRQCGIADVVESMKVKHKLGGWSQINFKTYEQGRRRWQGTAQHVVWLDEEPPADIYTEALTRLADFAGLMILTWTPLIGVSDVVRRFINRESSSVYMRSASWEDAPHLDEKTKKTLIESYPEHERETRTSGVPIIGSGAIFPVADVDISCHPFDIPDHFRRISGVDFGIDHPAAGVWCAHDADSDVFYVYDCYRAAGQTPVYHAAQFRKRGDYIPVSWPHDGLSRGKADGKELIASYREEGVMALSDPASYDDFSGSSPGIERSLIDMLQFMRTGRFKVFTNLGQWFEEKRFYHRANGKVVKEHDDILSATRYAFMMRRFAVSPGEKFTKRPTHAADAGQDALGAYRGQDVSRHKHLKQPFAI